MKCTNEKMTSNTQDTNLSWYVPKANVDHTINSQGTTVSTLDHSATKPRAPHQTLICHAAFLHRMPICFLNLGLSPMVIHKKLIWLSLSILASFMSIKLGNSSLLANDFISIKLKFGWIRFHNNLMKPFYNLL